MTDSVLLFTFSPVQSFIAEARRAADLYAGSRILAELAKAAIAAIRPHAQPEGKLIYPAASADDAPNKIVACVPWEKAEQISKDARQALLDKWRDIASNARNRMQELEFPSDPVWEEIWARQTGPEYLWGVYWAAAKMENDGAYKKAYEEASRALDAVKHSRVFGQPEPGERSLKDSLSGSREALHTANTDAREYWKIIGGLEGVTGSQIRPEGRERLDAIGAIKRFRKLADRKDDPFFSTSTVASDNFLERARKNAPNLLADYKAAVERLLGNRRYTVREGGDWPYDGDLFFRETLTEDRLRSSYGLKQIDQPTLQKAREIVAALHKQAPSPSPYYAIIVLDGDNMGKWISECRNEEEHRRLGEKLADFAGKVKGIVSDGFRVYNGGDDVLALASLSGALPLAQKLAGEFKSITNGTASAGIAIAHHLYPLDAALEAARAAEKHAKNALDRAKAAVSVRVIKRSGETIDVYSQWDALGDNFQELVAMFQSDALSSRFAYDVIRSAYGLSEADEKLRAELKRLLARHRNDKHPKAPKPDDWAEKLMAWAGHMPKRSEELGWWLALARFVAQGGGGE